MVKDYSEAFNDFISTRVEEIGSKITSENKKNRELADKTAKVFKDIQKSLTVEFASLIFEYEELLSQRQGLFERIMYEQGFKDGIELSKILNKHE